MENLTVKEAAFGGAVLGTMVAMFAVVLVLLIIACWKIFKKAGIPGWKSLIPIYNVYLVFKLSGIKQWFWYSIIISFVLSLVASLAGGVKMSDEGIILFDQMTMVAIISYWASLVFAIVLDIFASYKLAKAFKKGVGFTVGLVLLPTIFTLILGFGSAKYDKKVMSE